MLVKRDSDVEYINYVLFSSKFKIIFDIYNMLYYIMPIKLEHLFHDLCRLHTARVI